MSVKVDFHAHPSEYRNNCRNKTLESSMVVTWNSVWVDIDDAVIDGDDPMAVIDPLWWEVDIYSGLESFEKTSTRFCEQQKHVHAICWYNAEVCNGGHYQFFTNNTGIVWKRALDGFVSARMKENTDILRRCLAYYGGSLPFDRTERETLLDSKDFDFSNEDNAYFALGEELLRSELMKYIQAHRKEFKCSGYIQKPSGRP